MSLADELLTALQEERSEDESLKSVEKAVFQQIKDEKNGIFNDPEREEFIFTSSESESLEENTEESVKNSEDDFSGTPGQAEGEGTSEEETEFSDFSEGSEVSCCFFLFAFRICFFCEGIRVFLW